MLRTTYALAALAVLALSAPRAVDAQFLRIGAGVGPTTPVGDFGDVVDTGFHVRGLATFQFPLVPLRIRGEIAYNRLPMVGDGNANLLSGTVNGVAFLLPTPVIRPYVIGGGGLYRTDFGGNFGSSTDFGINAGAGIRANLGVAEIFVESRYEHVLADNGSPRTVPVTIGIVF